MNDNYVLNLYADWCVATGRDWGVCSTEDFEAFTHAVPASATTTHSRRLALIRHGLLAADRVSSRVDWSEVFNLPGALDVAASVDHPVTGRWWAQRLRARRDAFVAVALATGNLTRAEAAQLTPAHLTHRLTGQGVSQWSIAGSQVSVSDSPGTCAACAVVRWLDIAATAIVWSPLATRADLISDRRHVTYKGPHGPHACASTPHPDWRKAAWLVLSVDRFGGVYPWRPLSTRSVTAVIERLCQAPAPMQHLEVPDHEPAHLTRPYATTPDGELLDALDVVAGRADEVNRRVEEAIRASKTRGPKT